MNHTTWIIAHRGYHQNLIENTLEAFNEAFKKGAHFVECDIQLSSDGVPVIFHDDSLERFTENSSNLYRNSWDQIQEVSLSETDKPQAKIPSLKEYLDQFAHKPTYYELKVPQAQWENPGYLEKICRNTLEVLSSYSLDSKSFLASFHPQIARILKSLDSPYPFVKIFDSSSEFKHYFGSPLHFDSMLKAEYWDLISIKHPEVYSTCILNDNEKAYFDQSSGYTAQKVILWGLNEMEIKELKDQNFFGFVSDTF